MKKIFIASLVVISVFASSIVSALAIDKALTVYEIIKWGLTPHEVNSGEDEWVAMRDQTYALWQPYSSISSMARAFLSYDALSNLVSDLNGSGFPCYLEFNRNLQLYVVRGSGPVTGLTGVSVLDRYLTNGQRGLLCCEYNTDSLLSTISSTLTSLYNSLQSWFGGQLTGIYYWTNSINLSASRIDSALTSFLGNNTVSDIISAIPAASDLSNIESTLSSINNKLDNLPSSSGSAYDDSALLAALQPIISFYQDGVETVVLDSSSGTLFGNIQFERGTFSLLSLNASADADIFFLAENVYYSPSSLSFASPVRSSSSPTLSALGPTLTADADHITVTVKKTLDLPISVGTYDIQFFDTSGDAIALKTGDCFFCPAAMSAFGRFAVPRVAISLLAAPPACRKGLNFLTCSIPASGSRFRTLILPPLSFPIGWTTSITPTLIIPASGSYLRTMQLLLFVTPPYTLFSRGLPSGKTAFRHGSVIG